MSELVVGSIAGLAANSYVVEVASGSKLVQPGSVIGIETVTKTDTWSASVAGSGNSAITDLSITYTPQSASNKLLIIANIGIVASSHQLANVGIGIHNGTSFISLADAAGSRTRVTTGGIYSPTFANFVTASPSLHIVHSPGSTSAVTYTVNAINIQGATKTLYVNRGEVDSDNANVPRAASTFTIMEVAG